MSFTVAPSVVLASAVANAGTVDIAYPSGTTQATFTGVNAAPNTGAVAIGGNDVYPEASSGVRVGISYGGSTITITNNTGVTWPAGATLQAQLGRAGTDRPNFRPGDAITSLTDSSGGTASTTLAAISGTYTQSEVRNSIATLAAQIERILIALRANGFIS